MRRITGTDADELEKARGEQGDTAAAIRADVTSAADLAVRHGRLEGAFGTLDVLFADAGAAFGTPIGATDEAMYDRLMNVSAKDVFSGTQAALPPIPKGGMEKPAEPCR